MKNNFKNKTALVTGGTRGIGKSIVKLLLENGCNVIYTGTKKQPTQKISGATYRQLDLSNNKNIQEFEQWVLQEIPKVDILINNAGINIIDSIEQITNDDWDKVIQINLTGAMKLTRIISKIMKTNKNGGKILNISSIFGIISKTKRTTYSSSKFGLIGLTKASSLDLAQYNILVNALCPGFTLTELTQSILSREEIHKITQDIPLNRFAQPHEIAEIAVFLCSDQNNYITGQTIIADGGYSSQ
ncbi:MAG: SDR family oxidoreductase [Candidatus Thermoplasmatota archaeon]|nr:SDR family oxidoreductase [Candidatus Thermoplasmatota archaeon]